MSARSLLIQATFVILLAAVPSDGELGPCRFDQDKCSCKYNAQNPGTCWDRIFGTPSAGTCQSRSCAAGWSCSCPGRTHLCSVKETIVAVADRLTGPNTADCHEEIAMKAHDGEDLELGIWNPSFSRKGLLANACNQIAWWHNGDLIGNYGKDPVITAANIDAELERRTQHTHFEFSPGDLLAFRFKNASYYCYNSLSVLNVNGSRVDTGSTGVVSHFSKAYTKDWFLPSFAPNYATSEATALAADFQPLRNEMISGAVIVPGDDVWQVDDRSPDHATSNFYFRIQL